MNPTCDTALEKPDKNDLADPDKEFEREFEVLERIKDREARSRAVTLEILGDLPDADLKPPKNVLFICKLNPVTEADDLKIIFSRFGSIKSCNIVKDYKTGESLQYGFIEFEDEEACNNAYFKMDNVLIDDRRIHVDFCQSIPNIWKKYKSNKLTKGDFNEADKYQHPRPKLYRERSNRESTYRYKDLRESSHRDRGERAEGERENFFRNRDRRERSPRSRSYRHDRDESPKHRRRKY